MPTILDDVPESHRDLVESPLTATLTTIDASGRPQSTAVWYLVDDDGRLKGSVTSDPQKYRNLRGNPHGDLFIIDPQNPYRRLEVRAEAHLDPDPEKATVSKFASRYHIDRSMLDQSMLLNPAEDRYTVTYRPWRIVPDPPATA